MSDKVQITWAQAISWTGTGLAYLYCAGFMVGLAYAVVMYIVAVR